LMSLGIQASIWKKESACRPPDCGRESDGLFATCICAMANASPTGEKHSWVQSSAALGKQANLLICYGIASGENLRPIMLAACQWQLHGRMTVFCHRRVPCNYAERREIPSFCILNRSVDRFIPRRSAAPLGPATIQSHCARAWRMC
jgi:hypothetical protein